GRASAGTARTNRRRRLMSQYLLSVHAEAGGKTHETSMTPEEMQTFMARVGALESDMKTSGTFVFTGRLHDADAATVVRPSDSGPVMTDGPFVESKEHIAGFYIISAADLDAALAWAGKVVDAINAPIEVRPFFEMPGA
ncbi:MAG: YciI family protein, partial [Gaiellales bacterium]